MLMEARRRITSFCPSCCSAFLWIQLLFSHLYHHSHTLWMKFSGSCWLSGASQHRLYLTQGLSLASPLAGAKSLPSHASVSSLHEWHWSLRSPLSSVDEKVHRCCYCCLHCKNMPINHLSAIVKQVSLASELSDWTEKNFLLWHFPLVLITLNSCFRSCLH